MVDFNQAITKTLKHEGGNAFTNDTSNHFGATQYGISNKVYPELDIRNRTEGQAREIYRRDYCNRIHGNDIESQIVAETIFDVCINMGSPVLAS